MADISKITLPGVGGQPGSTYDLKDAVARLGVETNATEIDKIKQAIAGAIHFVGYTTTELTDGATTNPITINGESYTAKAGDVVIYNNGEIDIEFILDDQNPKTWNEFGTAGTLKALAFANTASVTVDDYATGATFTGGTVNSTATYTPVGSISTPTITVTPTTTTVKVLDVNGSVTAGTAASFTEGAFTPNVPTALDLTKFSGGSKAADTFDAGTLPSKAADTFSAGSVTTIDTTKFSGGSKAADTFSAGSLPSKEADTFSAGTLPTFKAGTFTGGSFTQGTDTFTATVANETLTLDFTQGTDSFTAATKAADTFTQGTLPSFTEGAFSAGSLPSYTEGAFTPAAIQTGFYTKGTAPSFTEGTFSAGTLPTFSEGQFTAASLAEGFYTAGSAASKEADTFNGGTPTDVTLPTFANATVATGIDSATATQPTFTGTEATINSTGTAAGTVAITTSSKKITVLPDNA